MRETDPVTSIKGIGAKAQEQLGKMGIQTVGDLIGCYPSRYDRLEAPVSVAEAADGTVVALQGELTSKPENRRGNRAIYTQVSFSDGTGRVRLTWFRMPYLANQLHKGDRLIIRGRLSRGQYGVTMEQPAIYRPEEYEPLTRTRQPVYALAGRLSEKQFGKWMQQALDQLDLTGDPLPREIRGRYGLAERNFALQQIHFPTDEKQLLFARERLVFEEFFWFILSIRYLKETSEETPNGFAFPRHQWTDRLLASLPYQLTGAQKRVWDEIQQDLTGERLMNRLVQGDVGSGKTVLAQLALVLAAENGYQGALMAPTEVLARQHYEGFAAMFEKYDIPVRCGLLTGSMTAAQKREMTRRIESHEVDLVIGTHALIQEKVKYSDLALVITDEQHRFGVRQRENLAGKGVDPHVLVMSATPIPRTLAIILYGDLDISVVDELPQGRKAIKNCVVGPSYRPKAWTFIRKQVEAGRQVYVICPLVEESEGLDAENVVDYAEKLRRELPPSFVIEILHGRMKPKDKNDTMERFLRGEIQVLVSTTVVEVGVNVPNATVMMVENAERFGLAGLHQLRGRVGRGDYQSYCIFLDGSGDPEKNKRLQILNHSNDGFQIASEDLKLRGPGDIFGIRQSGELTFALGDIFTDASVLQYASEAAAFLLAEDPELQREEHRRIAERLREERVRREWMNL